MAPCSIVVVMTFVAVVVGLGGVYSLWSDLRGANQSRLHNWLDEESQKRQQDKARTSVLFKGLIAKGPETAEEDEAEPDWRRRFAIMIEQSGLRLTTQRLLLISSGLSLVLGVLVALLCPNLLLESVAVVIGALGPIAYVNLRRNARLEQLQAQIPEAFDTMSRVLRAGHSPEQALKAVAAGHEPPLAVEFGYCHEQLNLGLPPERTLKELGDRSGLLELKILAMATSVQQRTGGNLAELLDKLATVARERLRMQTKIKTMTSEGRLQATLLLALPPIIFLAMLVLKPDYAKKLMNYPALLIGTVLAQLIGALWIRKIVRVKF